MPLKAVTNYTGIWAELNTTADYRTQLNYSHQYAQPLANAAKGSGPPEKRESKGGQHHR